MNYQTIVNVVSDLLKNEWIYFFVVLGLFFVVTKILIYFIENFVKILTKKTKTTLDDDLLDVCKNPILLLTMLYGLNKALEPLLSSNTINQNVEKILISVGILVTIYLIRKISGVSLKHWAELLNKRYNIDIRHDVLPLIDKVTMVIYYLIGVSIILSNWNIDVGPIVASLGVAGIVVGLALQEPLSNIFSGISLVLDRAYKVGDMVSLDSGESGIIYDVGLRSTKIKNWDGELLVIPNKKIANSVINNKKKPNLAVKINLLFGVEYGSDPEKVKKVVLKAIESIEKVSKNEDRSITIWFTGFGESSLDFKAMFWVDDLADKWAVHQEAMTKIYNALNKAKIGIPFPTRTVYMKNLKK
jgi:MscS family membrane protein